MKNQNIEDVYGLSPVQKGILFHTRFQPEAGAYIQQWSCTLRGALNQRHFQQSWQQVVDRHAPLRTSFVWEGFKEPLQIVQRQITLPWTLLDWRNQNAEVQQQQLESYLAADRQQGFAVERAPLMHCALIQLDIERHTFVWSCHHLALDGWSTGIVLQEAMADYTALQEGHPLPPRRIRPYRDYIAWLQQQDTDAAVTFWQNELAGFTAPTPLVVDQPQPAVLSDGDEDDPSQRPAPFGSQIERLSSKVASEIQAFAQQHRLTLNTIFQAAWALLLNRYSGEERVVFGTVTSGRPAELGDVENLVGVFINTLPQAVTIEANTSVVEWLQKLLVARSAREPHQAAALVDIRSWCELPGNTDLFQSLFVYENYPLDVEGIENIGGGLTLEAGNSKEQTHYPLELEVFPGHEIQLKINYDTARFDDDIIERMMGHYCTLLMGMVTNPDASVASLPMLTNVEQRQMTAWNETDVAYPTALTISRRFEVQAARTPDAIAVVYTGQEVVGSNGSRRSVSGERKLTYRELNEQANRLAHQLVAQGVGPDSIIALLAERSHEFLIAILAILKAGGAYMPLDPNHPSARIQQILAQSQAPLVLVGRDFTSLLDDDSLLGKNSGNVRHLVLEDALFKTGSEENLPARSTPEHLAYVLFTSGSTGIPKGVMIEQKGKLNHFDAMIDKLALTSDDIIIQNAAQTFDISVWQFLTGLLVGGQVHIVSDEIARDPHQLLAYVTQNKVTVLEVVPTLLRAMLDESGTTSTLKSLRWLIPTGEALPPDVATTWFTKYSQIPLINAYGPAECADDVTLYRLDRAPSAQMANMPIGRPIGNMRCYVLDELRRPVPVGVPGELYIAGVGVGRGYLHDPERTTQSFLALPELGEKRIYKTGDLARYLPDGNLEFLGRVDFQVKVRGYRIELGEIEATLAQHPDVRETVVVVREDQANNPLLTAYVVPAQAKMDDIAPTLRHFSRQYLPDYMVPAAFVALDALPLTPNGKVNRRALPAPMQNNSAESKVRPRTPVEESIVAIWRDVLGVTDVGVHDSFFDLGGHSLNATQVTTRIRESFAIEMPLQTLFAAPTVAELTQQIDLFDSARALLPPTSMHATSTINQDVNQEYSASTQGVLEDDFEEEEW